MIWSEEFLNQLAADAEAQIVKDVPCIYSRFYLGITAGQSLYNLPNYVKSILRITWRGIKIEPITWDEMQLLSPATAIVDDQNFIESSTGTPLYYAMHPTNNYAVRFYPTPNVTGLMSGDPYNPISEDKCIVSCYRAIDSVSNDPKFLLPTYIDRHLRKAFILNKAFNAEGKGQDLRAAQYYDKKYDFLISQFKYINSMSYISKKYAVEDGISNSRRLPHKPLLPSNYER